MIIVRVMFILLLIRLPLSAFAQSAEQYFVVIGAFRQKENAQRFTQQATSAGFTANNALQVNRQLYYVYILATDDRQTAYNLSVKTRVETTYKDAWVYAGPLEGATPVVSQPKVKEPTPTPVTVVPSTPPPTPKETEPVKVTETVVPKDSVATVKAPEPVKEPAVEQPKTTDTKKPSGKPFLFRAVSKENNSELLGSVHLQESSNAVQFQLIKIGDVVYLQPPVSKKNTYTVIAQVPGYQESTVTISYDDAGGEKGKNGETIITLTLDKAKRGDYIDFNNVHFVTNTSILKPESKNELDGLVNLMKENPRYKIKIYGHCNGTRERDATVLGSSTDVFTLDSKLNKRGKMSAKDLSTQRAETVKLYLTQQGIDASRITTKGEGGRIPLYPEGGTLGPMNDRIEIEFTKN